MNWRLTILATMMALVLSAGPPAQAQPFAAGYLRPSMTPAVAPPKPPPPSAAMLAGLNPLEVLDEAGRFAPSLTSGVAAGAVGSTPSSSTESAQRDGLSPLLNVLLVLTVITLAPSILLMCTSFVRMIMVLALLRQAIGTQGLPPPQVTLALSLFMTLVVMTPTIDRVYDEAITPYRAGEIKDYDALWTKAKQPVRDFMFAQIDTTNNWSSVYMMLNVRGVDTSDPGALTRSDVDMISLVPAYMLSELKTAFVMGFRIYLPFLVIDMVISSVLISMGMMMLPPVMVSLPFKLLLFVLVDGWQLVCGGLMQSFAQPVIEPVVSALPAMLPLAHLPALPSLPTFATLHAIFTPGAHGVAA